MRKAFRLRPIFKWFNQKRAIIEPQRAIDIPKEDTVETSSIEQILPKAIAQNDWYFPTNPSNTPTGYDQNFDNLLTMNHPCCFCSFTHSYNDLIDWRRIKNPGEATGAQPNPNDNISTSINRRIHYIQMYGAYLSLTFHYDPVCYYPIQTTAEATVLIPTISSQIIEVSMWKRKPKYKYGVYQHFEEPTSSSNTGPFYPYDAPLAANGLGPGPFPDGNQNWIQQRTRYALINPFDLNSKRLHEQYQWKLIRKKNIHFRQPQTGPLSFGDTSTIGSTIGNPSSYVQNHTASRTIKMKFLRNSRIKLPMAYRATSGYDVDYSTGQWITPTVLHPTPGTDINVETGLLPLVDYNQQYYFTIRINRPQLGGVRLQSALLDNLTPLQQWIFKKAWTGDINYELKTYHQQTQ